MNFYSFIVWTANPEILPIGSLSLRWYGLLFALGFLLGQQILIRIYKQEGKSERYIETLTIYMLVATVVGARLGHCLFYQPDIYLKDPIQILYIWEGGLASHGATIGILLGIYIYSRRTAGQSYLYVLDRLVIAIALGGALIRTGNLMNSEIIGKPTNIPIGFVFARSAEEMIQEKYSTLVESVKITDAHKDIQVNDRKLATLEVELEAKDKNITPGQLVQLVQIGIQEDLKHPTNTEVLDHIVVPEDLKITSKTTEDGFAVASFQVLGIPRHAAQLYEAISSFLLFVLLFFLYNRTKEKTPEGRIFALFVIILFSLRFFYEFLKEAQVDFEESMTLNMGQILSIPLVIAGIIVLIRTYRSKKVI